MTLTSPSGLPALRAGIARIQSTLTSGFRKPPGDAAAPGGGDERELSGAGATPLGGAEGEAEIEEVLRDGEQGEQDTGDGVESLSDGDLSSELIITAARVHQGADTNADASEVVLDDGADGGANGRPDLTLGSQVINATGGGEFIDDDSIMLPGPETDQTSNQL